MADKMSTLVLTVDLDCCSCCKKIKRILAKFPEIQKQSFDEKQKKVTICGCFDPEKLKKKLCCKACKYIIDIEIVPSCKSKQLKDRATQTEKVPPMVCCKPYCECHGQHGICRCSGSRVCFRQCYKEDGICRLFGYECGCGQCYNEVGICRRFGCESGWRQCYEKDGIYRRFGYESGSKLIFTEEDRYCSIM